MDDTRAAARPRPVRIDHELVAIDCARDSATHAEPSAAPMRWFFFRVQQGDERIAAAHLAARRFGVYLPEVAVQERAGRGRRRWVRRPFFAGRLLVLMWDTAEQHDRVRACPGVIGVETFASCPVILDDKTVAWIQLIEADLDGYKGSRKKKGWRRQALADVPAHEPLTIKTRDAFHAAGELDAKGFAALMSELLVPLKKSVRRA